MAASRRAPDPMRIAAAKVGGIVDRAVVARRLTDDQALVEIGAALAPLAEVAWPKALASVAQHYLDSERAVDRARLELLVRAGADLERARVLAARPEQPLNPPGSGARD